MSSPTVGRRDTFGYNENTADIGRYSTWGPFLIWAYAVPAFFFGPSVNVVLWCNLLLITLGIAYYARSARLNVWQCLAPVRGAAGCVATAAILSQRCIGGHAVSDGLCHRKARRLRCAAPARPAGWSSGQRPARSKTIFSPLRAAVLGVSADGGMAAKKRRCVCLAAAAASFVLSIFSMTKMAAAYFGGGMDFAGVQLLFAGSPDSGCAL